MIRYFLIKTTIFISIFIIAITSFLVFGKMAYFNREYPMWKVKFEFTNSNHNEYKNIILGDSRAFTAFRPNEMQSDFYNLSLGGGSPIEIYYQLEYLLEKNHNVNKVILSFSPSHLQQADVFFERTLKFSFFEKRMINETLETAKYFNEDFTISSQNERSFNGDKQYFDFLIKANLIKKHNMYYYRTNLREFAKNPTRIFTNQAVYNYIKKNEGHYFFGRKSESSELNIESQMKDFNKSLVMEHYLKKIINLCMSNNIQIFYINLPFNESSFSEISDQYIVSYNSFFQEMKTMFPTVKWSTEISFFEDIFFGDSSHLNAKGVSYFLSLVNKDINKWITQ